MNHDHLHCLMPSLGMSQMRQVENAGVLQDDNGLMLQNNGECSMQQVNALHQKKVLRPSHQEHQAERKDNHYTEEDKICFVCSSSINNRPTTSVRVSMDHSHAPLIVLLTDVLGYKLDGSKIHSQIVCDSCYRLLNTIDEMQQILAESKSEVRTKFLETIHRLKLKYPRTDKMLRPRCLRCIQMTQTSGKRKHKSRRVKVSEEGEKSSKMSPTKEQREGTHESEQEHDKPPTKNIQRENSPPLPASSKAMCEISQVPGQREQATDKNACAPSPSLVYDTDPAFFSLEEKLKVGFLREDQGSPAIFSCLYCVTRYESAISLKMHVRVHHMPVLVYDNGQGTSQSRYRMGIKLQNTMPTELIATEKPFACLFCESSYKLQSSLQLHFRENHSPHKPHQCLECKESFRKTIELSRHRAYRCPARKPVQYSNTKR